MTQPVPFVIGGFGNVGQQLARLALADPAAFAISAIAARDLDKARRAADALGLSVPVIRAAGAPEHPGVLVECSTYEGFRDVVEPTLRAGGHVIAVSAGALGVNLDLVDLAQAQGAVLQIAGGALPGLDILAAALEGSIEAVRLISHIRPESLAREAYVLDRGIDLGPAAHGPVPVFAGSARDAARHFPRHFNVAVTLGLGGIGLDRTEVDIRADGTLPGARHTLRVSADAVALEMTAQNYPSPQNNRTSRIVAQSLLAALRRLGGHLRIGT